MWWLGAILWSDTYEAEKKVLIVLLDYLYGAEESKDFLSRGK